MEVLPPLALGGIQVRIRTMSSQTVMSQLPGATTMKVEGSRPSLSRLSANLTCSA